ncbi:MAG: tetratricopeptide repeat protein [Pseudomonadota bacterium]
MRFAPCFLLAAPLLAIAAPAHAQEFETVASTTIERGDYRTAEKLLTQEVRRHGTRPEFMLNLAAVYVHTGRAAEARALYQQVLARPDVAMELVNESAAGSHAIARAGLRRLETPTQTARAD